MTRVPESWEVLQHRHRLLMSPELRKRVRRNTEPPTPEVLREMLRRCAPK